MSPNPYESPREDSAEFELGPRVSRRMVFWGGVAMICLAVVMVNGSEALIVHGRAVGEDYGRIAFALNCVGMIAIVAGCVALVIRHWIPEPRQPFSWRRRR